MNPNFFSKVKQKARNVLIYFLYSFLLLFLVALSSLEIFYYPGIKPLFFLVPFYLGVIWDVPFHTVGVIFVASIFNDSLCGYPLGLSPLVSLLLHYVLLSIRHMINAYDFYVNFSAFTLYGTVFTVLTYLLLLYQGKSGGGIIFALDLLITALLFPLVSRLYLKAVKLLNSKSLV